MPRTRGSKTSSTGAKVDPALTQQLEDSPAGAVVGAVFTLKTPAGQAYLSSSSASDAVDKIVKDAVDSVKAQPVRVTVFPNVQSFAVYGPPALVRKLIKHPEVASAIANKQNQDMLIRPVTRGPAAKPVRKKR